MRTRNDSIRFWEEAESKICSIDAMKVVDDARDPLFDGEYEDVDFSEADMPF